MVAYVHTQSRIFPLLSKMMIRWWLLSERNRRLPLSSAEMQPVNGTADYETLSHYLKLVKIKIYELFLYIIVFVTIEIHLSLDQRRGTSLSFFIQYTNLTTHIASNNWYSAWTESKHWMIGNWFLSVLVFLLQRWTTALWAIWGTKHKKNMKFWNLSLLRQIKKKKQLCGKSITNHLQEACTREVK